MSSARLFLIEPRRDHRALRLYECIGTADFAKLVELFGAHDVSFVSVTQQFNTTTSMGRLTLKRAPVLPSSSGRLPSAIRSLPPSARATAIMAATGWQQHSVRASSLESSARSSVLTWCQNQANAIASIASSMTWRHELRQTA